MRTLGTLVHDRAAVDPDDVAIRAKVGGAWQDQTWSELAERVDRIAAGLLTSPSGLQPGDTVGILAETSRDWIAADFAALSVGARTVPIYTSLLVGEVGYVHVDTAVKLVVVGNATQYGLIQRMRGGFTFFDTTYPAEQIVLQHVVVIDPTGLAESADWESLADLESRGRAALDTVRSEIENRRDQIDPETTATFTYTSGTTGPPKAVIQSARNHLSLVEGVRDVGILQERMRPSGLFLFLPLAHSFGRLMQFAAPVHNLPVVLSSVPTLADDLRETRPGFLPAAPRVYEKVKNVVEQRVAESSPVRRRLFGWATAVGRRAAERRLVGEPLPRGLSLQLALADRLVLSRVRAQLGLDRTSAMLSGAAPLHPSVHWFFLALGLDLYEAYGLTETCPGLSSNRPGHVRVGTVGLPLPGVELVVSPDGEILARGPNITRGYHNLPEETRAAIDDEGWFHTGDEGTLDDDGYLTITGRKKDLIKTSGGKYVAPAKVEGMLKLSPLVQEAVLVGDGRPYCTALIAIDDDALAAWSAERGLPATKHEPQLVAAVDAHVAEVNSGLASFETVKYWEPIDSLSVGSGLLTASLKVKRAQVAERWQDEVEAMYRRRK